MFHTVLQRGDEKCYIYFTDNSLPFQQWKNFQNWLTVDEIIAKKFDTTFLITQSHTVYMRLFYQ